MLLVSGIWVIPSRMFLREELGQKISRVKQFCDQAGEASKRGLLRPPGKSTKSLQEETLSIDNWTLRGLLS